MVTLKLGPWKYQLVRGAKRDLGTCQISPLVRVASFTRRRLTVGQNDVSGAGVQWVSLMPIAVLVQQPGIRRLLLIGDRTRWIMWALGAIGVVSCLVAGIAGRRLQRPKKKAP